MHRLSLLGMECASFLIRSLGSVTHSLLIAGVIVLQLLEDRPQVFDGVEIGRVTWPVHHANPLLLQELHDLLAGMARGPSWRKWVALCRSMKRNSFSSSIVM
jgi:hypothetical protein